MKTRIISFYSDFEQNKYYETRANLLKQTLKLNNYGNN